MTQSAKYEIMNMTDVEIFMTHTAERRVMDKKTLKEYREEKGMKQRFVADFLGITRQSMSNKESGKSKFSALEVQKLCNLFGVDISAVALK